MKPATFTLDDARRANDEWGFNCGPGAICAVTGLTPDQIRPSLGDFERRGYTTPRLMNEVLTRIGVRFRRTYRSDMPRALLPLVENGVVRVQWGGRWTNPGVPTIARYRYSHWIGVRGDQVFDINAIGVGGWISFEEWSGRLVPWLLARIALGNNGAWWPTHAIEVSQ